MREIERKGRALTSVLAGYKIDPIAELDFQIAVAHKILESDFGYDSSLRAVRRRSPVRENPSIPHLI